MAEPKHSAILIVWLNHELAQSHAAVVEVPLVKDTTNEEKIEVGNV